MDGLHGGMKLRIETAKGKHGKNDRIILFTSTDINNIPKEREAITIFKICLLINQLTYNELKVKNGFKKKLLGRGEHLYFEEAIKESIEMAKIDVNWAESHNLEQIKEWAKKWNINTGNIEPELKRTFQTGIM